MDLLNGFIEWIFYWVLSHFLINSLYFFTLHSTVICPYIYSLSLTSSIAYSGDVMELVILVGNAAIVLFTNKPETGLTHLINHRNFLIG